jgi:hypothetical protein
MKIDKLPNENLLLRSALSATMILLAGALRIAPHPWNFAPVGALALFSGALLRDRRLAFLCAMVAMLAGDLVLGFNKLSPLVYASFAVSVLIGRWLKDKRTVSRVAGITLLGALQFFVITNLGVWAFLNSYPRDAGGLLACYIAGIPFFWNTLAGDALYATLLFGGFALAERIVPALRQQEPARPWRQPAQ